nr:hypothetical protein [uncultured Cupriavidus sp.]
MYPDDVIRRVLVNGVGSCATAEWPWLSPPCQGDAIVRRRGFRTLWGKLLLYTYEEFETLEVGVEGYISEDPFFDLGKLWGSDSTVGTFLSDLVSMHFARITRGALSRAGWCLDNHDKEGGRIFRVSSAVPTLDEAQSVRLGKALGTAILRANVEHLCIACQGIAYLEGLKDFSEAPTRPIPNQAGSG